MKLGIFTIDVAKSHRHFPQILEREGILELGMSLQRHRVQFFFFENKNFEVVFHQVEFAILFLYFDYTCGSAKTFFRRNKGSDVVSGKIVDEHLALGASFTAVRNEYFSLTTSDAHWLVKFVVNDSF